MRKLKIPDLVYVILVPTKENTRRCFLTLHDSCQIPWLAIMISVTSLPHSPSFCHARAQFPVLELEISGFSMCVELSNPVTLSAMHSHASDIAKFCMFIFSLVLLVWCSLSLRLFVSFDLADDYCLSNH